jgi:hypothetical protein
MYRLINPATVKFWSNVKFRSSVVWSVSSELVFSLVQLAFCSGFLVMNWCESCVAHDLLVGWHEQKDHGHVFPFVLRIKGEKKNPKSCGNFSSAKTPPLFIVLATL